MGTVGMKNPRRGERGGDRKESQASGERMAGCDQDGSVALKDMEVEVGLDKVRVAFHDHHLQADPLCERVDRAPLAGRNVDRPLAGRRVGERVMRQINGVAKGARVAGGEDPAIGQQEMKGIDAAGEEQAGARGAGRERAPAPGRLDCGPGASAVPVRQEPHRGPNPVVKKGAQGIVDSNSAFAAISSGIGAGDEERVASDRRKAVGRRVGLETKIERRTVRLFPDDPGPDLRPVAAAFPAKILDPHEGSAARFSREAIPPR